jgi:hypothetical protein
MASLSDYDWWIKNKQLGIGTYNTTSSDITAHSGRVNVRYSGPKYAEKFTERMNQESELPPHFHRALIAGVLRDYYEERGDTVNMRIQSGVFNRYVRKGREYAYRNRMTRFTYPQSHEYPR